MEEHNIPPRNRENKKPAGPENQDSRPEQADKLAGKNGKPTSEDKEDKKDDGTPSREEVITTWTKPVTNQDEQEKITNAGGADLPGQEN